MAHAGLPIGRSEPHWANKTEEHMSRSINLQRRVLALSALPAGVAFIALAVVAVIQLDAGSTSIAAIAGAFAVALTIGTLAALRRTTAQVDRAIRSTLHHSEAVASGRPLVGEPPVVLEELAAVNQVLSKLDKQQRILRSQSEAIGAQAFDSPILNAEVAGPIGEVLRDSVDGIRQTAEQLRDTRAMNSSIMDNVSDAIVVVNPDGSIIAANGVARVALDSCGGDLDEAVPNWRDLPTGDSDLSRTGSDGTLTLTQVSTSRMMTADGAVVTLCWRDISGERAVAAQVAHVRLTDIVTGLANRQGLLAELDKLHEMGRSASLIHVDLADFSQVNERYGFPAGDHVLQVLSERLSGAIRDGDILTRIGGDEFVFVLDSSERIAESLAHRVLDRIREPIELSNGANVALSARAGWSSGLVDDSYELLRHATYALGEARGESRAVSAYTDEVAERDNSRREWEEQLLAAIENDEFVLFAQPIVDVFERRVLGVEIFLRWKHPSGRLVTPAEFISIAEESELIADIDRWVIRRCLSRAAAADPNLVFSLNVSTRFIANPHMADFVLETLAETGLPSGRIQIDVTETNVASDAAGAVETIRRLNETGVKVALDDFGTGYSSLAHLLKLDISTIKIDRGMVSQVGETEGRGVIAAILAFARNRSLTVVAEGVESEHEVAVLSELGCRYQQGYYHARPAPLADVLSSLDAAGFRHEGTTVFGQPQTPTGSAPPLAGTPSQAQPLITPADRSDAEGPKPASGDTAGEI